MYTPVHVSEKIATGLELEQIVGSRCLFCNGEYDNKKRTYFKYFDDGLGWWHAVNREHKQSGISKDDRYSAMRERHSLEVWAQKLNMRYGALYQKLLRGERLSSIIRENKIREAARQSEELCAG